VTAAVEAGVEVGLAAELLEVDEVPVDEAVDPEALEALPVTAAGSPELAVADETGPRSVAMMSGA